MAEVFNAYQKLAATTYDGGEFADVTTMQEVNDCGDGLFRFLMVELSNLEDCVTLDEARRRVRPAVRELTEVIEALT